MKSAFITGVTGQDGSYLAEFLLSKGYRVHAILRRSSVFTTGRIENLLEHPDFCTYYGDLSDSSNLHSLLAKIEPNEIYNLGAQSHVAVSFQVPEYTAEVNALGTIRLLNAIKDMKIDARYYQASTSELFGGLGSSAPQNETTPFSPRSPYAAAKLYAYWITVNYRESYGLHASNGILFNHESPRRGHTFVTRKITMAVARIAKGLQDELVIGNLHALRDWGFAKEYVECMWLMLQQDAPDDYVVATGQACSVREFIDLAFAEVGISLHWEGSGINEVGMDSATGKVLVRVDPKYFRPTEVDFLLGNPEKIYKKLGWKAKVCYKELVKIMMKHDIEIV